MLVVERALRVQYKIEAGVTTLAYGAATISLLADIIGREVFQHGIWGAPRFAVYAAIIAGFLGMALAAADNSLIRPRLLDFVIPPEMEEGINRLADLVSAILYGGLFYLAVLFVWETYDNGDVAPVLDWPLWPIQLILPYTFLSVSLRYFAHAVLPLLKLNPLATGEEI
ncbi:MAG: TRAP transporter small permease [Sneathiella sp.]|nr:TRAP transporter small permease [Sneathiella sp.]